MQRAKIAALNLEAYFSAIIISGEVGFAKPSQEIFAIACEQLQVEPAGVIFIGDNFEKDIEGSAKAGLKPIWINRDATPIPAADFSFGQIVSLKQLVIPRNEQT
jgi:putative hydrolase of the HAD superfamily